MHEDMAEKIVRLALQRELITKELRHRSADHLREPLVRLNDRALRLSIH